MVWLLLAGFIGGVLNTIAGGGSFITFPALMMAGLPPVVANATNTFASSAGYASGVIGFWHEIKTLKGTILYIAAVACLGASAGAYFLLITPNDQFQAVIPWLMLFATVLFIFGGKLYLLMRSLAGQMSSHSFIGVLSLFLALLLVCIYGGFFNAGLGIVSLSYLALAGYTNIHVMNGIKLVISTCVSIVAVLVFAFDDVIAWQEGSFVLIGTLVGGYVAARVSKRLSQSWLRAIVVCISLLITTYFFWDVYGW